MINRRRHIKLTTIMWSSTLQILLRSPSRNFNLNHLTKEGNNMTGIRHVMYGAIKRATNPHHTLSTILNRVSPTIRAVGMDTTTRRRHNQDRYTNTTPALLRMRPNIGIWIRDRDHERGHRRRHRHRRRHQRFFPYIVQYDFRIIPSPLGHIIVRYHGMCRFIALLWAITQLFSRVLRTLIAVRRRVTRGTLLSIIIFMRGSIDSFHFLFIRVVMCFRTKPAGPGLYEDE